MSEPARFEFAYPLWMPAGPIGIPVMVLPSRSWHMVPLFSAGEEYLASEYAAALGPDYYVIEIRTAELILAVLRTLHILAKATHVELNANRPDSPAVHGHYYPIGDVIAAIERTRQPPAQPSG